jgi:hypothetical protein
MMGKREANQIGNQSTLFSHPATVITTNSYELAPPSVLVSQPNAKMPLVAMASCEKLEER